MTPSIPELPPSSNANLPRIRLVQGKIEEQAADAIVSVLPQDLEWRGSVNAAIHKAAGENLDHFVLEHIYKPMVGDVYAVPGFALKARHVIFCVMPVWRTDIDRTDRHLVMAARKAVETAHSMNLRSVAFPPLASGGRGYPPSRAARLLIQGIYERMYAVPMDVSIVCPDAELIDLYKEKLAGVQARRNIS